MLTTQRPIDVHTWHPVIMLPFNADSLAKDPGFVLNDMNNNNSSKPVLIDSMDDLYHPGVPVNVIYGAHLLMTRMGRPVYFLITNHPKRLLSISRELRWTSNIRIGVQIDSPKDL